LVLLCRRRLAGVGRGPFGGAGSGSTRRRHVTGNRDPQRLMTLPTTIGDIRSRDEVERGGEAVERPCDLGLLFGSGWSVEDAERRD
jgi:hypothetical protein